MCLSSHPRELVPRTRSSHHNCRESECELRVQSGTRIIKLLVSFDSEVRIGRAARLGELRNRDTSPASETGRFRMKRGTPCLRARKTFSKPPRTGAKRG